MAEKLFSLPQWKEEEGTSRQPHKVGALPTGV
jgi:hypothetical protein